ncbi:phosphotransferase family enzyme [Geodermatophilus tzadiensis]|uniref:Phosphotransferase family enzyme n=1 Tax=Geodermatophilus tzadiensis TaxID=1137988 RepID=A0A2T0TTG4_9ACTN|nr:phosphotransferase [Geodermatophilus tzadiensis]PRY48947.1 phosphotransferase family enzyme [Geodermatophilus tzadiensis]
MPGHQEREVPLEGGTTNHGRVVRVGDTVRRPLRPSSPATHALLEHLERVGFPGAPRFLGIDEQGREVLSYVPGRAATAPHPAEALTDAALVSVAHLLRDYHRAVAGLDPAPHPWPASPPPDFAGELVSHNDVNLDNVVFRGGRAVALIDFDLASPGSRLWDVACAVRLWAPLRPDRHIDDARRGRALRRLRVFADAYGLDGAGRDRLAAAVLANHEWCYDVVTTAAANGHAAFARYWWAGGAMRRAAETRQWYLDSADLLRDALS